MKTTKKTSCKCGYSACLEVNSSNGIKIYRLACYHCGRTGRWSTTKDGAVNLFNDDDIARKVKGNVDFNTKRKHCKFG